MGIWATSTMTKVTVNTNITKDEKAGFIPAFDYLAAEFFSHPFGDNVGGWSKSTFGKA